MRRSARPTVSERAKARESERLSVNIPSSFERALSNVSSEATDDEITPTGQAPPVLLPRSSLKKNSPSQPVRGLSSVAEPSRISKSYGHWAAGVLE
jgi:hypothetical protein